MISYYVYMALLVVSLVLWLIIAVREDRGSPSSGSDMERDSENKS
jgi:hypothetical protein